MEDLKRKHLKERNGVQRSQCALIDKLVQEHDKQRVSAEKRWRKKRLKRTNCHDNNSSDSDSLKNLVSAHNEKVKIIVAQQTKEWSDMVRQQQNDEYLQCKKQCREQWDLLRKLLDDAQKAQIRRLRVNLEIESRNLRANQTKKSMDDSRQIQTDKSIKTKGEKDRRTKELHEKNLKLFLDERRRLARKHELQEEQLKKIHIEQKEQLEKESKKALEMQDQIHQEAILAAKPETVI